MKTITLLGGGALLIITVILIYLLKSGGALKPAGLIKPAVIGTDTHLMGRSIALRLFPEFQAAKNVIWYLENSDDILQQVPQVAYASYQATQKPLLVDMRSESPGSCAEGCWLIQNQGEVVSKSDKDIEIYVQYFSRDEKVPENCETEKILEVSCVRPVSVREVRKKFKTDGRYFFMQRYLNTQFFLFVER